MNGEWVKGQETRKRKKQVSPRGGTKLLPEDHAKEPERSLLLLSLS